MAEYISRDKLNKKKKYLFQTKGMPFPKSEYFIKVDDFWSIPIADVIELKPILEEYEELIQTNPTSKAVDEFCIKTMRKILCDYYVEKI